MNSREIRRLMRTGIKQETEHFTIFHGGRMGEECAIIASKISGNAVERNRLKRRIRSVHCQMKTPEALYILKRGVEIPGYRELLSEIKENNGKKCE